MAADRLHDRSELRERAGPEVIAVCKSARDDHAVDALQIRVFVPQHFSFGAEDVARDVERVVIAVGTGENDDTEFHKWFLVLSSQLPGTLRTENRELSTA